MDSDLMERINAINDELGIEVNLWMEECKCLPNDAIIFDVYLMNNFLTSLVSYLVEKEIIKDEEFTLYFKEKQLEHMRIERPKVKAMRLQELQKQLVSPKMHIPKGHKH